MPVLCQPAVVLPEHTISLQETLERTRRLHKDHPRLSLALRLISNTGVARRHLVQPLDLTLRHPGLEERQRVYVRAVREFVPAVVKQALHTADLAPDEIDAIVFVSCTGFTMPSPTAWMINSLGFRTDTTQLPIAQLGCAAGGAAINRAYDFCVAHPRQHVLVVACEFCSLCYQPADLTVGNLLSNGLFGDAVAAAVVRGEGGTGMRLEGTGSRLVPGTQDWIAYAVKPTGFHFLLDKRVPGTMRQLAPGLREVCAAHGWDAAELDFYVIHAGGPRILDDLVHHLGITRPHVFDESRATLTHRGNIASAVVLDAFGRHFTEGTRADGDKGIIAGFGPGITAEITLGTWTSG